MSTPKPTYSTPNETNSSNRVLQQDIVLNGKRPSSPQNIYLKKKLPTPKRLEFDSPLYKSKGENKFHGYSSISELNSNEETAFRILEFRGKPASLWEDLDMQSKLQYFQPYAHSRLKLTPISKRKDKFKEPIFKLDASGIVSEDYSNVLDWNERNFVALALGNKVCLWNATTGNVHELMEVNPDKGPITSLVWAPDKSRIAIGLKNSELQIWDSDSGVQQGKSREGHSGPVTCLSWNRDNLLSSGGKSILSYDDRIPGPALSRMDAHEGAVWSLKWAPNDRFLASGGGDKVIRIWDSNYMHRASYDCLHRLSGHQATVKALEWNPLQWSRLASGAGTGDNRIFIWNISAGKPFSVQNSRGREVTALLWNHCGDELLSAHGSKFLLWGHEPIIQMAEFINHGSRVLSLAQSPNGCTVASASVDGTLQFWQVFGEPDMSITPGSRRKPSRLNPLFLFR